MQPDQKPQLFKTSYLLASSKLSIQLPFQTIIFSAEHPEE
jgi:hypothetical protein